MFVLHKLSKLYTFHFFPRYPVDWCFILLSLCCWCKQGECEWKNYSSSTIRWLQDVGSRKGIVSHHCEYLSRLVYWLSVQEHTHPFNGPLSRTTRVSQYQKGKTNLDFTEARDSEWQWHQLDHMQVCTSPQTDNHASTPPTQYRNVELKNFLYGVFLTPLLSLCINFCFDLQWQALVLAVA